MNFSNNWILSQIFGFISLILVIISYQQKGATKLLVFRNAATLISFVGLIFLGDISAIIMCGAGVIRNAASLYFSVKGGSKKNKRVVSLLIIFLLILLNIIYWKNILNVFSIVVGTLNVITFMQSNAKRIRKFAVVAGTLSTIYGCLIKSPLNALITAFGLISAIVGIIRLDRKQKS